MTWLLGLAADWGLSELPGWGLSLLMGGPVGVGLGFLARNWKLAIVVALVVVSGVWIGIDQVRLADARAEVDRNKAERAAEQLAVAERARQASAAALARALEIQERYRADAAAALQTAQRARQDLARAREEIARDPDARTPVAAPVRRYLDRLRQRRAAEPRAGADPGGARGADRPRAAAVRAGAGPAAGRDRP